MHKLYGVYFFLQSGHQQYSSWLVLHYRSDSVPELEINEPTLHLLFIRSVSSLQDWGKKQVMIKLHEIQRESHKSNDPKGNISVMLP